MFFNAKHLLRNIPQEYFTDWLSSDTPPIREGYYIVKFDSQAPPEFSEYTQGKWRILLSNPNVNVYLHHDYVRFLKWYGLTKEGYDTLTAKRL